MVSGSHILRLLAEDAGLEIKSDEGLRFASTKPVEKGCFRSLAH
jgi:hypothetical protein